ncbi:MAG TPA: hypothetical protein VFE62_28040 [Gemmataceae bacterium]|nr:hypothetical protein [Gemmataceae bacterium]
MKKWIVPAVVVCLVLAVGYLSTLSITVSRAPKPDRQAQVDKIEEETDRAVRRYKATTDELTDLSVLAERTLRMPVFKELVEDL